MAQKYPSGPINQHKALATGGAMPKCDTSNKGGGFDKKSKELGPLHKSGTAK